MKRISFLLTLFVFIGAEALAQFQNPVTFSATQKKVADDVLEVIFQGTIDAGWHVYGTDIADGGPTRAELTLETQKGVKPDGKLRATGKVQKKMDKDNPMPPCPMRTKLETQVRILEDKLYHAKSAMAKFG